MIEILQELLSDLPRRRTEVHGGEPDLVILDDDEFIHIFVHRGVEEQARGIIPQGVAAAFLGPQIGVDLVDVPAAQRFFLMPAAGEQGVELRIDDDAASLTTVLAKTINSSSRVCRSSGRRVLSTLTVYCMASKCAARSCVSSLSAWTAQTIARCAAFSLSISSGSG